MIKFNHCNQLFVRCFWNVFLFLSTYSHLMLSLQCEKCLCEVERGTQYTSSGYIASRAIGNFCFAIAPAVRETLWETATCAFVALWQCSSIELEMVYFIYFYHIVITSDDTQFVAEWRFYLCRQTVWGKSKGINAQNCECENSEIELDILPIGLRSWF